MDSTTVAELLKSMNSTEIITTLTTLESSGYNVTQLDIPSIISQLNVTQVEGLLSSNSTVVNGLLTSLSSNQLYTLIGNFQNVTSQLFSTGVSTNNSTLVTEGTTLLTLLLEKIQSVFTDSQLLGLFEIMTNGAALGTGSKKLLSSAKSLIKGFLGGYDVSVSIPSRLTSLVEDYEPAMFGDYPTSKDIAPSAIFLAIFAIFTLVHTGLFIKNYSLGHKFFISLGLAFYSLIRTLGFILRIVWAKDLMKLDVGLTSTIFMAICTVFLPSLNLILAQRYFTWKHPLYGSHKIFMGLMYLIYALVLGVIVMTIVAAAVQINYTLGAHHFKMTKQVVQAASVLILLYSLGAFILVVLAFIVPSTKRDQDVLTYQPYWIKSFRWNYFVPKGAAKQETALVSEEERHAVRVINSSSYHYKSVNIENAEHEKPLHHTSSIYIIFIATLLLFISNMFRCVSTFIEQYHKAQSWIFEPVVMYIMYGVLETFVNLLYIFGRVDLRFYKADSLKVSSSAAQDIQTTTSSNADVEKEAESGAESLPTVQEAPEETTPVEAKN